MKIFRLTLIFFLFVLLTPPLAIKIKSMRFEMEREEHIRLNGNDEGFYGDCSGVTSLIIPMAVCIYAFTFFVWGSILIFSQKKEIETQHKIQIAFIGILGVLPVLGFLLCSFFI